MWYNYIVCSSIQERVRWLIWAKKYRIMFLKSLNLQNYRNLSNNNFNFDKKINIFIGNNAQGKTNVLESIYFLAITKSHRTNNELNLIKNGEPFVKVEGVYEKDDKDIEYLSVLLNERGKKVSINNIAQRKISNYLSRMNVIMFCPDDLEIIKGTPSGRRKFLNVELSQFKNEYVFLLKEYNQLLKQRNEYLKQKNNRIDNTYFDIITDKLIDKNIKLIKLRYDFIDSLNIYLSNIFNSLCDFGSLIIKYKSFISKKDLTDARVNEMIKKKYLELYNNEILQKTTLLGCHKDDFRLYLNDKDVTEFCSQGQQRLSILSLKLAEIEVFKNYKKINPIILLDDIFSELDKYKKNNIINYFKDDIQIFITTTEIDDIFNEFKEQADIFVLDSGNVTKEEK